MRHTAAKTIAALAIASALTAVAVPAMADPATGVTPAAQDIVGVGSDTTQALFNQFSADYAPAAGQPKLYSWDAIGSATITPKTGATTITRPNGSSAGINALNANTSATVDFARSSRSLASTDPTNDWFLAFAKDGITWSSTATSNSPTNLTFTDLVGIYTCDPNYRNWSQIVDIAGYVGPNVPIKPYLPQTNSGTRSTWLKILGGGVNPITPGACVTTGPQENQGTDPVLNDPDVVFPYSAGHYAGQLNGHNDAVDNVGVLKLRQADGLEPLTPVPPAAGPYTVASTLTNSRYGRVLYNVVRGTDWNAGDAHAAALQAIFGPTGWICTNATAGADLASYGFLGLASGQCGVITHN